MSLSATERPYANAYCGGADGCGGDHLCVRCVDIFCKVCGESKGREEGREEDEEDEGGLGV